VVARVIYTNHFVQHFEIQVKLGCLETPHILRPKIALNMIEKLAHNGLHIMTEVK
jgi:hypothetical protein